MKNTILILSFVISSLSLLHAQIINTVCGVGSGGYYGDGGQATAAALYSPCQLAADKSGNIYIADYLNNVIRKITVSSGIITTIAGNGYNAGVGSGGFSGDGAQATDAELYFPTCVTLDTTGNIYIADYRNNRVRKVNVSTGIISTIVGTGTGSFSGDSGQATNATLFQPGGLALDNLGDLYIADALNNRIRKVIMTTGIITTIAGTGPRAYSGDGGQATAAELAYPIALTLDTSGNIFVADFANNRIRKITISTGVINTFAGTGAASYSGDGGAAALAEMNGPGAIAADKVGNIYIADIQNSRIREVVASSGIINTIAGTGVSGYSGDGGLATAAELTSPDGIAINSFGNVYLADAGPNIIREIVGPAGIQEIKSSIANVAVYPNPNNGVFTIQLSRVSEKSSVEIYNMLREEVFIQSFNSTNTMVDISNKVAGIYMYRVLTETGLLISEGKIVKE